MKANKNDFMDRCTKNELLKVTVITVSWTSRRCRWPRRKQIFNLDLWIPRAGCHGCKIPIFHLGGILSFWCCCGWICPIIGRRIVSITVWWRTREGVLRYGNGTLVGDSWFPIKRWQLENTLIIAKAFDRLIRSIFLLVSIVFCSIILARRNETTPDSKYCISVVCIYLERSFWKHFRVTKKSTHTSHFRPMIVFHQTQTNQCIARNDQITRMIRRRV